MGLKGDCEVAGRGVRRDSRKIITYELLVVNRIVSGYAEDKMEIAAEA